MLITFEVLQIDQWTLHDWCPTYRIIPCSSVDGIGSHELLALLRLVTVDSIDAVVVIVLGVLSQSCNLRWFICNISREIYIWVCFRFRTRTPCNICLTGECLIRYDGDFFTKTTSLRWRINIAHATDKTCPRLDFRAILCLVLKSVDLPIVSRSSRFRSLQCFWRTNFSICTA